MKHTQQLRKIDAAIDVCVFYSPSNIVPGFFNLTVVASASTPACLEKLQHLEPVPEFLAHAHSQVTSVDVQKQPLTLIKPK